MPKSIENLTPSDDLDGLRQKAFKIWSIVLFLAAAWVFIILFAPIAAANGWTEVSSPIYSFYGYICHQMPSRSFHMMEHQFAVCSRCFGVYFGVFAGLLIYPFMRPMDEIEPFPRIWLFISMIPMAVDWSLTFFGYWENTHFTRITTGLILGVTCALFIAPALVELSQVILMRKTKNQRL